VKGYVNKALTVLPLCALLLSSSCNKSPQSSSNDTDQQPTAPVTEVEMVLIPAGEFIRGSNKVDDSGMKERYGFPNDLYLDEHPEHKLNLDEFYIDVYEVTNALYKEYILHTKRMMPFQWINSGYSMTEAQMQAMDVEKLRMLGADFFKLDMDTRAMDKPALIKAMLELQKTLDQFPVGNISWFDAKTYCQWREARLPTEAEWEKAARGTSANEYPWGNQWDANITNTGDDAQVENEQWENGIAPVGSYPNNRSPYGVYDMSGNVWEWVDDWYDAYPGSDYENDNFGKTNRVIRGGGGGIGHYAISYFFRAASRQFSEPELQSEDVGFRCAKDAR
jgi:formylglycine-generating enzyme required for sulfatase activity